MTFRPFDEPELIEVKDWSVWLRFPEKVSQSEVHELLQEALTKLSLWPETEGGERSKWEMSSKASAATCR